MVSHPLFYVSRDSEGVSIFSHGSFSITPNNLLFDLAAASSTRFAIVYTNNITNEENILKQGTRIQQGHSIKRCFQRKLLDQKQ